MVLSIVTPDTGLPPSEQHIPGGIFWGFLHEFSGPPVYQILYATIILPGQNP